MKTNKRIAILQPEVPHYREEFFEKLGKECNECDIYVYNSFDSTKAKGFNIKTENLKHIANRQVKGFLFYNPMPLLNKKYDTIVLMLHFAHITTWLLLLTKFIHRKEIILWGQGISVKRYLKEEKHPDRKLKWQIALADGVWLYMKKELAQWKGIFPRKKMTALNNTLTGVKDMCQYSPETDKCLLKNKYGISQETILIFCARFESNYRRTDLLEETIKRLDGNRFGFVIIGSGKNKPDFTPYDNVYDFGAVYDTEVKRELFSLSDIYFQPGWVGLSIVEAMAYGKPIFTFERSEDTKQCVEYSYIVSGTNGMVFKSTDECVGYIESSDKACIEQLGCNARNFVKENLSIEQMVNNAISIL